MTVSPCSDEEMCDFVAAARAKKAPFAVIGGGTKNTVGRPMQVSQDVSSSRLVGVTEYEPSQLFITARAGTAVEEIKKHLSARNQELPFDPPDLRGLLGCGGDPTIGAVAATNMSGPRRVSVGAVRDFLLGVRFVSGSANLITAGGQVMKNVTGLDLTRLLAGSWGTLGIITSVTFKVLPRPERTATLILSGLSDETAVRAMAAAARSPFEASGFAHVPANLRGGGGTFIRIQGFERSVRYRSQKLRELLSEFGVADLLEDDETSRVWTVIRDVRLFAGPPGRAVWRIHTRPDKGPGILRKIAADLDAHWFYDWAGSLVWLSCSDSGDAGSSKIRSALASEGHATLIKAPPEARERVPTFQPLEPTLMRLTSGIKLSFDPDQIMNPGRMYHGV